MSTPDRDDHLSAEDAQRLSDRRERLLVSRRLAVLMDDLVRVPGTNFGIGMDAVIGLFPGIGDLLGSGISGAIMVDAVRARVPVPVLARMAWNIILDALLGLIPVAGDAVDVAHRANRKNYRLLERAVIEHPDPRPPTAGYLIAAITLTVAPLVISIALAIVALVVLFRVVGGLGG